MWGFAYYTQADIVTYIYHTLCLRLYSMSFVSLTFPCYFLKSPSVSLNLYETHLSSLPVIAINWSVIILTFCRKDVAIVAHSFHISNVMQYWCETLVLWDKCVLIYNWGVLELLSIICCSVESHVTVDHVIPPINAISPKRFDPGTSRIVSHALPTEAKEISTNAISRDGYEFTNVPITFNKPMLYMHYVKREHCNFRISHCL